MLFESTSDDTIEESYGPNKSSGTIQSKLNRTELKMNHDVTLQFTNPQTIPPPPKNAHGIRQYGSAWEGIAYP